MNKIIIVVLAILILGGLGAWYWHSQQGHVAGSAVGATFGDAKIAFINFSPATGTATSTSILNTDSSDRKVTSFQYDCSGVGTSLTAYTGTGLVSAGLVFSAATTSTANPAIVSNTNAMQLAVATGTPDSYNILGAGTTTPNALTRVWSSGSYMTFSSNATNTAACTIGVGYLAS